MDDVEKRLSTIEFHDSPVVSLSIFLEGNGFSLEISQYDNECNLLLYFSDISGLNFENLLELEHFNGLEVYTAEFTKRDDSIYHASFLMVYNVPSISWRIEFQFKKVSISSIPLY